MLELITDRTAEDAAAYRAGYYAGKGGYRYADLNRVGAALRELSGRLAACGVSAPVSARTDWTGADYPTREAMDAYLADVRTIRGALAMQGTTPEAPPRIAASAAGKADGLDWAGANAIEQIMLDVEDSLARLRTAWWCAGEVSAGEV